MFIHLFDVLICYTGVRFEAAILLYGNSNNDYVISIEY